MLRVESALVLCTPQHKTRTGSALFHELMTYKEGHPCPFQLQMLTRTFHSI
uniref:Uncharacterized protein n=1 Tax=Arundo donax TaxID=35708 RepID=A0A0A9F320_ARUDO